MLEAIRQASENARLHIVLPAVVADLAERVRNGGR
jgi:hypothetical protein